MGVSMYFLYITYRWDGRYFLCRIYLLHQVYHALLVQFWVLKTCFRLFNLKTVYYLLNRPRSYCAYKHPHLSCQKKIDHSLTQQFSTTHFSSGHLFPAIHRAVSRFHSYSISFQHFSIRIYMLRFTQTTFPNVMASFMLFRLNSILQRPHKAATPDLDPNGSTFAAKPFICPFIDVIALVKPLMCKRFSILISLCHNLSLLALPSTMAPPSTATISGLLFPLLQSSFLPPRIHLSNTARLIKPNHEMSN